jgi:hypothetical protein
VAGKEEGGAGGGGAGIIFRGAPIGVGMAAACYLCGRVRVCVGGVGKWVGCCPFAVGYNS